MLTIRERFGVFEKVFFCMSPSHGRTVERSSTRLGEPTLGRARLLADRQTTVATLGEHLEVLKAQFLISNIHRIDGDLFPVGILNITDGLLKIDLTIAVWDSIPDDDQARGISLASAGNFQPGDRCHSQARRTLCNQPVAPGDRRILARWRTLVCDRKIHSLSEGT